MLRRLMVTAVLVAGLMVGLGWWPAVAAPAAVLWERWTAHDPEATDSIDHK